MTKLLIIIGPTATGKTKFGVELAKKYNGEIISADSRQVYKGLDIITGKDKGEYGEIPVWGIDLVDPDYSFNVSDFVKYANSKISEIVSRNKLPIIVGGTALYIKALVEPFETIDVPPDEKLRSKNLSVADLQKRLGENNLNQSDYQNPRRLTRAIEAKEAEIRSKEVPKYESLIISLTAPLEYIYKKIDIRVDERLKNGALEEARIFPNSTALGVKEAGDPDLWKLKERQYAKRQITFIKKFLIGKEVLELDVKNEAQKNPSSKRQTEGKIDTFLSRR